MLQKTFEQFVRDGSFRTKGDIESLFVMTVGLAGESGEVCELLKKYVRDDKKINEDLLLELGDVLHYLTMIAHTFDMSLDDVMEANINKLIMRRKNNPGWKG